MTAVQEILRVQSMSRRMSWLLHHHRMSQEKRCEKTPNEIREVEEEHSTCPRQWLSTSQILPSSWSRFTRSLPYYRFMNTQNCSQERAAKKQQVHNADNGLSDIAEEGEILADPPPTSLRSVDEEDEEKDSNFSISLLSNGSAFIENKRIGLTGHQSGWSIDSVSLAPRCMQRLRSGGLLDDSLIEFFFRFVIRYAVPDYFSRHIFFFNSYFYTKLIESGENSTSKQRHHAVRRWTNKLNQNSNKKKLLEPQGIWEFDLVVVPLNPGGTHWTLALVTFPLLAVKQISDVSQEKKTPFSLRLEESLQSITQRLPACSGIDGPGIFHLDSLQGSPGPPPKLKETLVAYFQEEFSAREPDAVESYRIANVDEWKFAHVAAPKQKNAFDCGIFLIEYIRFLLTEPERVSRLLYGALKEKPQNQSEEYTQRPTLSSSAWFNQTIVTHRRMCLRTMLSHMQQHPTWSADVWSINTLVRILNSSTGEELRKAVTEFTNIEKGRVKEKVSVSSFVKDEKFQESCMSSQCDTSVNLSLDKDVSPGKRELTVPAGESECNQKKIISSPPTERTTSKQSSDNVSPDIKIAHFNKKTRRSRVMAFSEEND